MKKQMVNQIVFMKWYILAAGIVITLMAALLSATSAESKSGKNNDVELSDLELLGKYVFYDKISSPSRMACVTCHDPATGGTGSVSGVNLHQVAITGANPHTIGNLKPPTNAYATLIDPFHPCNTGGLGRNRNVCGGNFWNGRSEGNEIPLFPDGAAAHIGEEIFYTTDGTDLGVSEYAVYFGPTADQALNPMPNPVEQNIERQAVCEHVESSKYAPLYEKVWGVEIDCSDDLVAVHAGDVGEETAFDISFKRLALAMAAYQGSEDVNSFSSKRDHALRAELACVCQDVDGEAYPGDNVCSIVAPNYEPSVCTQADYLNSPGEFPLVGLTEQENFGHDLFYGIASELNPEGKNAGCAACHSDNPPNRNGGDTGAELFQLYSADDYHNIGTPPNPEIPVSYDSNGDPIDPDLGIAGHAGDGYPPGFFKTPTLRNVDKRKGNGFTKAYTHNGWFKSLESIVHFYNTAFLGNCVVTDTEDCTGRGEVPYENTTAATFGVTRCPENITTEKDALAHNCWPEPAYGGGAIPFLVGDLGLTANEEAAIVAYMRTLTDEHTAQQPKPYK